MSELRLRVRPHALQLYALWNPILSLFLVPLPLNRGNEHS